MKQLSNRITDIIDELIEQYLEEDRYNRPWIIGFSGGKDSTVLLTLVWIALQRIRKDSKTTLDVRVRIVCGMVNKLDANKVSFELKIRFMECIWDTYKEFSRDWEEWHAKWILGLPF